MGLTRDLCLLGDRSCTFTKNKDLTFDVWFASSVHPGGAFWVTDVCGEDSTSDFSAFHEPASLNLVLNLVVGPFADQKEDASDPTNLAAPSPDLNGEPHTSPSNAPTLVPSRQPSLLPTASMRTASPSIASPNSVQIPTSNSSNDLFSQSPSRALPPTTENKIPNGFWETLYDIAVGREGTSAPTPAVVDGGPSFNPENLTNNTLPTPLSTTAPTQAPQTSPTGVPVTVPTQRPVKVPTEPPVELCISLSEVENHALPDDCWYILYDTVYDLTTYM